MKVPERVEILIYVLGLTFCIVWLVAAASLYVGRALEEEDDEDIDEMTARMLQQCEAQAPCQVTLENGETIKFERAK
jgi:hypothetical protein